jgi:hypothetical protein
VRHKTEILSKITAQKKESTKATAATNPEHVKLYEHVLGDKVTEIANKMMGKADSTQVTTDAITHAICDSYPEVSVRMVKRWSRSATLWSDLYCVHRNVFYSALLVCIYCFPLPSH